MDQIEIRQMSVGEIDTACRVVALAFATNPNTLAVTRGDQAKAQRIIQTGARVAKLGRKCSRVLVAKQAGKIVGVLNAAEWPDCQMRMGEMLKTAPAMLRVMGSALPRQLKLLSLWGKRDPRRHHWHLGPIGVLPERQGRGIGKALLTSFLEQVDEQGTHAYLETDVDSNVALYEQFHFKVISQADFEGVNNRFMWRAARPLRSQDTPPIE
jgi:ribosomal protein S18 acetylase RimI-like enzyme